MQRYDVQTPCRKDVTGRDWAMETGTARAVLSGLQGGRPCWAVAEPQTLPASRRRCREGESPTEMTVDRISVGRLRCA